MQKKARQDNKGGKDAETDEKKLNVKEEEQSEFNNINRYLINFLFAYIVFFLIIRERPI